MIVKKIRIYATVFFIRKSIKFGPYGIESYCYVFVSSLLCAFEKKVLDKMCDAIIARVLVS
jgi:hypothetical protein